MLNTEYVEFCSNPVSPFPPNKARAKYLVETPVKYMETEDITKTI